MNLFKRKKKQLQQEPLRFTATIDKNFNDENYSLNHAYQTIAQLSKKNNLQNTSAEFGPLQYVNFGYEKPLQLPKSAVDNRGQIKGFNELKFDGPLTTNKKITPKLLTGFNEDTCIIRLSDGKTMTLRLARDLEWKEDGWKYGYIPDLYYNVGLHANDVLIVDDNKYDPSKAYNFAASESSLNRNNQSRSQQWENNRMANDAGRRTNDLLTAGLVVPGLSAPLVATVGTFGIIPTLTGMATAYGTNYLIDTYINSVSGGARDGWADVIKTDVVPLSMHERMPITVDVGAELSRPGNFLAGTEMRLYNNARPMYRNSAISLYNSTPLTAFMSNSKNALIVRPGETVIVPNGTTNVTPTITYKGVSAPLNKAGMVRGGTYNTRPRVKHGATTTSKSQHKLRGEPYTLELRKYEDFVNSPIFYLPTFSPSTPPPENPPSRPPLIPPPEPITYSIIEDDWKNGSDWHDWYAKLPSRTEPYVATYPATGGLYIIWRSKPDLRVRRRGLVVNVNGNIVTGYANPDSTTVYSHPYTGTQVNGITTQLIPKPTPGRVDTTLVLTHIIK